MEQDIINVIRTEIGILANKVNKVYDCLVGNEMSKDGGLVQRLIDNEAEVVRLEKRLEDVEKKEHKRDIYVNIIWTMVGCIGSGGLYVIFKMLSKS